MATVTPIEYLPTEIWLDVFRFMWLREVRQSFSSLNKRFDALMKSSHLHWHAVVRDREKLSSVLDKSVIRIDRVVSLRLRNRITSTQAQFLAKKVSELVHLRTLVLGKGHTLQIRRTIASVGHQLVDLSVMCVISNELAQQILTLPFLRHCSLTLSGASPNFLPIYDDYSLTIERLTISLKNVSYETIFPLLMRLPRLRRLRLAESYTYFRPTLHEEASMLFSQLSHLHLKFSSIPSIRVHQALASIKPWPLIFSLDVSCKEYISMLPISQWFDLCTTAIDASNHCQISIELSGRIDQKASEKLEEYHHPLIVIDQKKYSYSSDVTIRITGVKGSVEKFYY